MERNLKCKDFDAWVSFLGRLKKIGSNYLIKNDILIASVKGTKSGSNDIIPGRHLIKDPFFINDEDCYVKNGIYISVVEFDILADLFKNIKETNKEARKEIIYIREKEGIYIQFYGMEPLQLFSLVRENDEMYEECMNIAGNLTMYKDYLIAPYDWIDIPQTDIIDLRNNELKVLRQNINDKMLWARVARSVFIMAGVTRIDVSFADKLEYTFIQSDNIQKDTAILRIHGVYKSPGGSKLVEVNCIHEYVVLIYDEGE